MLKNGRQPGLLEQYAHLFNRRPGQAFNNNNYNRQHARQGTVKRLVRDRGFGFIRPEGQAADLFFHRSSLRDVTFESLNEGDFVQFDVERDQRRDQNHAINVRQARKP